LAAEYQALRFLLREKMVSMPEVKVLESLRGRETATLEHIQKSTFLNRYRVEETVEQLAKRGVVSLDRDTGQVRVLKPIDI